MYCSITIIIWYVTFEVSSILFKVFELNIESSINDLEGLTRYLEGCSRGLERSRRDLEGSGKNWEGCLKDLVGSRKDLEVYGRVSCSITFKRSATLELSSILFKFDRSNFEGSINYLKD